ncbi:MAG: hypothetical protein C0514_08230 [Candidatus Puniceispirillum sp.]|nr:hypothetical protein [Candidatus Puniceispirillum sp.]
MQRVGTTVAIFHAHTKMIGRKTHDTVKALAYRAGTTLTCPLTGQVNSYANKSVPWVWLLLPKDAPLWARDIQEEITHNRRSGVQKFCNVIELAEKRVDAQVYREFEFSLPRELTLEQNIALAQEFLQDQVCGMGISVMANMHLEEDKDGNPHPHCHALFLTRRSEEKGLSSHKEREWNARDLVPKWRESLADYINFHLAMNGHEARVDHRSYEEQGIDLLPQPKLGWLKYFSKRDEKDAFVPSHKQREREQQLSYNTAKILARPEIVFEAIAKRQSTFMWGDVEAILAANIKDKWLFDSLSERLLNSRELECLGEIKKKRHASAPIVDTRIYTTRSIRALERSLMEGARRLSCAQSHAIDHDIAAQVEGDFDERLVEFGGLSKDQKEALAHILAPKQLACVTGFAGTGKTTIVEAAKNVWERSGYQVVGLAPTGRARDNLSVLGLKAMTVHSFLKGYGAGRNQYKNDTVFVLDEAGMVDVERFAGLVAATKTLGVKLVAMGDSGQLQAIEAGDAFRLVTGVSSSKNLTHVVRQRVGWQRKASQNFGEGNARQAVETYFKKGRIRVLDEHVPRLGDLIQTGHMEGVVRLYNLTRRMTGNIYVRMREDMETKMGVAVDDLNASLPHHPDWELFTDLCATRRSCVEHMMCNIQDARPLMRTLGVDPVEFARTFTDREMDPTFQSEDVTDFIHEWALPLLDANAQKHVCDLRKDTREKLLQHWKTTFNKHPGKTLLISTNSKAETTLLNQELRGYLRDIKVLSGKDVSLITQITKEDSLGKTHNAYVKKSFAKGDRILFCKADKGLGVANGDLGTLLKVSEKSVSVRLDSGKEVSFSPTLYKNFDHGWAINIYKTQGLTVDYHFVLGSLQDYQNLSYVGMTRHRKDLFVYASALDFWRKDVLLETLSKPKEKLTALDYGEETVVTKEDNLPLSHARLRAGDMVRSGLYLIKQGYEDVGVRYFGMLPRGRDFFVPQGTLSEHERAKELTMFAHLRDVQSSQFSGHDLPSLAFLQKQQKLAAQHVGAQTLAKAHQARLEKEGILAPKCNVTPITQTPSAQKDASTQQKHGTSHKQTPTLSPQEMRSFVESITRDTDVAGLAMTLMDDHGLPLNKALSKANALRFGNKGSIVVNTGGKTHGTWHSFEENKGGGVIQLVQHVRGGSFKEALSHMAPFVTGRARQDLETFLEGASPTMTQNLSSKRESSLTQNQDVSQAQEKALKHQEVKALVAASHPLEETVARSYLKGRQIQKEAPKSLRFLTPGTTFSYQGKIRTVKGGGALLSCAMDEKGVVQAAQITYLDPSGARARSQDGKKFSKITYGSPKGAFVPLQKEDGPLYVAEGMETALSLREVGVKGTIVASLGITNMENLPIQKERDVVLVADWDGEDAPSQKMIERAKLTLTQKGMKVRTLWPSKSSEHKLDFNDLLMNEGPEKVRQVINNQGAFSEAQTPKSEIATQVYIENSQTYLCLVSKNKTGEQSMIPMTMSKEEKSFIHRFEVQHPQASQTIRSELEKNGMPALKAEDHISVAVVKLECLVHLRHFANDASLKKDAESVLKGTLSNMGSDCFQKIRSLSPQLSKNLETIATPNQKDRALGI